jgi:dephospho-CoA kinase
VRTFGLTGNIGSGKSTVARILVEKGIPVVDADQLAREVVLSGTPALAEIAARFPGVVSPQGVLDRKALGARVFADEGERRALNAIVHPRIAERSAARMAQLAEAGTELAIYEAALVVENGLHEALDGLIVVVAPEAVQLARLLARDGMTAEEARARIAAQLPQERKVALADFVIDNSGSREALVAQVEELLPRLRQGGG